MRARDRGKGAKEGQVGMKESGEERQQDKTFKCTAEKEKRQVRKQTNKQKK